MKFLFLHIASAIRIGTSLLIISGLDEIQLDADQDLDPLEALYFLNSVLSK